MSCRAGHCLDPAKKAMRCEMCHVPRADLLTRFGNCTSCSAPPQPKAAILFLKHVHPRMPDLMPDERAGAALCSATLARSSATSLARAIVAIESMHCARSVNRRSCCDSRVEFNMPSSASESMYGTFTKTLGEQTHPPVWPPTVGSAAHTASTGCISQVNEPIIAHPRLLAFPASHSLPCHSSVPEFPRCREECSHRAFPSRRQ